MEGNPHNNADRTCVVSDTTFTPARFPVELGLPPADESLLKDAKTAVRQEFRDCSKWKRLRCRKVSVIAERDRGTIYAVHVGSSVEFDWTWEGAVAFRPHAIGDDGDGNIDMADFEESPVDEASLWSGEVLEVDERNGCLFISLSNPENPPILGAFLVRPFHFLGTLDAIYHEPRFDPIRDELCSRLVAAAGGVHPRVAKSALVGLASFARLVAALVECPMGTTGNRQDLHDWPAGRWGIGRPTGTHFGGLDNKPGHGYCRPVHRQSRPMQIL